MGSRIDYSQNRKLYVGTVAEVSIGDGEAIVAGNVGIGTTSTTNGKLVIDSTANQIAIETGTAGDGRLNIGHFSNGTFIGTYGDDGGAADLIRFGTHSGDTRMTILSGGNVGIGTDTLTEKLRVQGVSGSDLLVRFQPFTNNASSKLYLSSVSSGDGGYYYNSNNNTAGLFSYGDYTFNVGTTNISGAIGDPRMVILQGGNVGIGTTNPSVRLSIVKPNVVNTAIDVLKLGDDTNGLVFKSFFDATGIAWRLNKGLSGINMMTFTQSGSVGIGTTLPTARLDILTNSSSGDNNIDRHVRFRADNGEQRFNFFVGRSGNSSNLQMYDSSEVVKIVLNTGDNSYFNGGHLGIGTTSPTSPLMIAGSGADGTAMLRLEATGGSQTFNWISSVVYPSLAADKTIVKLFGQAQTTNNQAWIGFKYAGSGSTSNQLSFGFYANNFLLNIKANGNVGIGTESPDAKFQVGATISVAGTGISVNAGAGGGNIIALGTTNHNWFPFTNGQNYYSSDVHNFRSASHAVTYMVLNSTSLTASGDIVAYGSPSDKRLKENIKPIKSALDKVSKLQGVTFNWKKSDSILDIKEDIGFIAQDVQKVVPELVRENENGMLSMRHQGMAPILLEAIKELKAEIEELKSNKCNCNK